MSTLGSPRRHLRSTTSTNEMARALAEQGAPHGTLVTAGWQSAGRGRQGRKWVAPAGRALLLSLVLRDVPDHARLLPLAAGVAVAEVCGPDARIKWPNDVLLTGGGKVAGILAEGRPLEGWAVLGIGLNVAVDLADLPPELLGTAATLGLAPEALEPTLTKLLGELEVTLALDPRALLDAFRERDALLGREIAWAAGRGRAVGIDGAGRLMVRLQEGRTLTLDAGEVHLEGPDEAGEE